MKNYLTMKNKDRTEVDKLNLLRDKVDEQIHSVKWDLDNSSKKLSELDDLEDWSEKYDKRYMYKSHFILLDEKINQLSAELKFLKMMDSIID